MTLSKVALATAVAGTIAACGGSSSSGPAARLTRGAVTATSVNAITVNGAVIDDSSAAVTVDDSPKGKDDIKVGHVVVARVDDRGRASEVHSRSELRGRVDDKGTSTVTIGGQMVRVDDSTQFDDSVARFGGVSIAERVRVSGYADDKGGIRATRIERDTSASTDFEIHGVASSVTASGFTLTVSAGGTSYTVTLASGVTLPSGLGNGAIVEVRSATQPTGSSVVASSVKLDDDLGDGQEEAEIEGIVTSGTSGSFVIARRTITTSASTRWIGGGPGDLVPGTKVEAEGRLDASGTLAASKVSFADSLRLQSPVSNVTPAASGGAANGTFKMFGGAVTVHVSDSTEFDSGVANLTALAALGSAANVEVRGYPSASGGADVAATRIRLGSGSGGRIFVQGPVTAADPAAKTIKILVFTIDVANAQLKGRDETTVLAGDFFANVTTGTVVKARANSPSAASGTTLAASEIELEDDK
jgi:Domain of unknown function (DUF5666)